MIPSEASQVEGSPSRRVFPIDICLALCYDLHGFDSTLRRHHVQRSPVILDRTVDRELSVRRNLGDLGQRVRLDLLIQHLSCLLE